MTIHTSFISSLNELTGGGLTGIGPFNQQADGVFKISYYRPGALRVRLYDLSSDFDLYLYRDSNLDGILDTGVDTFVGSSTKTGNNSETVQTNEQLSPSTQTYFALVKKFDTSFSSSYSLGVARVVNTDAASFDPNNVNLSISGTRLLSPEEIIKFDSSSTGRVNFSFSNNDVNALSLYADSNKDGFFDGSDAVIKSASSTNSLTSDLGKGAYFLKLSRPQSAAPTGNLLVTTDRQKINSDFNGDGKNDLVIQNQAAGWAGIWTMNGTSLTGWAGLPSTGGANIVGVGDFNGDGKNDIVLQNQAAGWAGVWTMNNSTITGWAGLSSTGGGTIVV